MKIDSRPFRSILLMVLTVFFLTSCTSSFYSATPVPVSLPSKLPTNSTVPNTNIQVGIDPYNNPDRIHSLFGHNGLWRKHILALQISLLSSDKNPTDFLVDSAYVSVNGHYYPSVVPNEVFDISWQAKHPYILVKETLYYTGLILFTVATLGLGSVIWVLPSPFSQPSPQDDPFGRDLNYKAFTKNVSLQNGSLRGGFLFFTLPALDMNLKNAQLVLHFTQKTPSATERTVTLPLTPGGHLNSNLLKDLINGFLQ
ncbi:MAG: hypothetical protein ACYCYP_09105 [Leptospirales bacterium]